MTIPLMKEGTERLKVAFGEELRELRNAAGLSQERLGLECDLDRTYISLLERGLRQPSLTTLFALAARVGVTPSRLIQRVERRVGTRGRK